MRYLLVGVVVALAFWWLMFLTQSRNRPAPDPVNNIALS